MEILEITLEYWVEDSSGKEIVKKVETVAIETQASFVESLKIPKDIQTGSYLLKALVITESNTYKTESSFRVIEGEKKNIVGKISIVILAIVILAILIVLFIWLKQLFKKRSIGSEVHNIVNKKLARS